MKEKEGSEEQQAIEQPEMGLAQPGAIQPPPKALQAKETKAKAPRGLSVKAKSFLRHLAAGRPTLEAYKLAGYSGEPHAAYQLRCDLKAHLAAMLESGGFSRESLAAEINKLNALPLDPSLQNVNFRQKLDILRLMDKALPKQIEANKSKITPFKLSFSGEAPKLESIEGEVVNEEPSDGEAQS